MTPEQVSVAVEDREAADIQANRRNLIALLRREARHSGVWFAHRLTEAADTIEELWGTVAQYEAAKSCIRFPSPGGKEKL